MTHCPKFAPGNRPISWAYPSVFGSTLPGLEDACRSTLCCSKIHPLHSLSPDKEGGDMLIL